MKAKQEQVISHKDCGGIIEFDGFGNYRCKKCGFVSKERKFLEIIQQHTNKKQKTDECKECQLCKINNPKHPICNYHQGYQKAKAELTKKTIKTIQEMENHYPKDIFKWDNKEKLNFNRGRFNRHCFEIVENVRNELKKKIEEIFE